MTDDPLPPPPKRSSPADTRAVDAVQSHGEQIALVKTEIAGLKIRLAEMQIEIDKLKDIPQ